MKFLCRRFHFLIYYLVLYFGVGGTAFFTRGRAWAAVSPSAVAPLRVAVLPLSDGKVPVKDVQKVADTLRDELRGKPRFAVLSKEETDRYLASGPPLQAGDPNASPLNRYLEEAKEFYKNFQFKEAVGLLENTISSYRASGSGAATLQLFRLTDAYLMLGNIQLGDKNERRAEEAFREAVRLDTAREIGETQYPPKTVALFQKTRQEFLHKAKPLTLELQSSPARAEVYLNGDRMGVTPLRLDKVAPGEHFIYVTTPGYRGQSLRLQLKNPENRQKIELTKLSSGSAVGVGLAVSDLRDIAEQVRLGSLVGKSLSVDKVVWVSLEEVGWNNKITARMIDMKYQASYKQKSIEVLDLPKDTRSASQLIATDLEQLADVDLAKDPKKYADGEVIVIGTKKKKSFLKSPVLWSLVGVLVAGGAASAFLIGKGGGGGGNGTTAGASDNTASVSVTGASSRTP